MSTFLLAAAGLVLATVAVGLLRVLHGPGAADRMMAAQLLGTGGIAALLLLGVANARNDAVDVALVLALLAPLSAVAFVKGVPRTEGEDDEPGAGGPLVPGAPGADPP